MNSLNRRDMLKGALGSSLAILLQDKSAPGQVSRKEAERTALSVETTNQYATQKLFQQLRPTHEPVAVPARLDPSQFAWVVGNLGLPPSGVPNWKNRDIYDIHGQLLFMDKTHRLPGGNELRIRTAASKRLITPVWESGTGPYRDIDGWITRAKGIALKRGLKPVDGQHSLVCYCYPKLGLLCDSPKPASQVVLDLVEASREVFRPYAKEEAPVWSPFDKLGEAPAALERFAENVDRMNAFWQHQVALADLNARASVAALASETYTLHIDLELQKNDYYCAVATGVMLLGFHNIHKTQDQVATLMKTTEADGSLVENQVAAYEEISKKGVPPVQTFEVINDVTPDSAKARLEIFHHRMPFCAGTPWHARAAAGWRRLGDGSEGVQLYDPGTGDIGWLETWEALSNFIFVRPKLYN